MDNILASEIMIPNASPGSQPVHAYHPGIAAAQSVVATEIIRAIPVAQEPGVRRAKQTSNLESEVRCANQSSDFEPRARSEAADRVVNVAIAIAGLILAAPVMLVFAALIKFTSPGPIFYSQARVGLDRRRSRIRPPGYDRRSRDLGGRPFMIYKFRTMCIGAEKPNGAVWASREDSRVTAVGRVMRKYRVDEFPQLINVIRGEMNIVGPRPERPSIFSRLCDDIVEYPLRQRARPGITGWAQVNNSYDTDLDDVRRKVRYDLEYLERQGVAEDLRIMARTVPVMIFRKGGW